jgi:hypothetical protein
MQAAYLYWYDRHPRFVPVPAGVTMYRVPTSLTSGWQSGPFGSEVLAVASNFHVLTAPGVSLFAGPRIGCVLVVSLGAEQSKYWLVYSCCNCYDLAQSKFKVLF